MLDCDGRTVLEFLMDYWTVSNVIVKFPPTAKKQIFLWYSITFVSI